MCMNRIHRHLVSGIFKSKLVPNNSVSNENISSIDGRWPYLFRFKVLQKWFRCCLLSMKKSTRSVDVTTI